MNRALWMCVVVFTVLVGCYRTEYSEVLTEPGVVANVIYTPATHGTGLGPTFTTGGDVGFTVVSVSSPEYFSVVFRCAHGGFVISGNRNSTAHAVFTRVTAGDSVTIYYREILRVKSDRVEAELLGYDFLDAMHYQETVR